MELPFVVGDSLPRCACPGGRRPRPVPARCNTLKVLWTSTSASSGTSWPSPRNCISAGRRSGCTSPSRCCPGRSARSRTSSGPSCSRAPSDATELTPAGRQLLDDARPAARRGRAARRRVAQAARGPKTFTVGFMPGLTVTTAVRAFAAAHPERRGRGDPDDLERPGRRTARRPRRRQHRPPADRPGRADRPPAVRGAAGRDGPVRSPAGRQAASSTSPISRTNTCCRTRTPYRNGATSHSNSAPGRPKPIPAIRSVEEKLEHVAAGRGISIIPLSVATFYQRTRRSRGTGRRPRLNKVSLAWIASRRSRLLHDFADLARAGRLDASRLEFGGIIGG